MQLKLWPFESQAFVLNAMLPDGERKTLLEDCDAVIADQITQMQSRKSSKRVFDVILFSRAWC
jgi:hypothetical protein